jgi:multiple sugar transport system ATP-binding protein
MVFQNYALYPSKTVAENIGFPLKMRAVPKEERDRRVLQAARLLDLEPFLDRKPRALSGGQRQRVAMGRAIVREPQAVLRPGDRVALQMSAEHLLAFHPQTGARVGG